MSASDVNTKATVGNVTVIAGPSSIITNDDGIIVGVGDTLLVAANPARTELTVTNDSPNIVYLRKYIGSGANIGKGIRLNPNGGSWTTNTWKGSVHAVATAANSNVCISES